MAIDFLILILIIISLFVNLLALGAFWVTPGLRTMANRFVINLLIINIIGCCILTPPLFIKDQQLNSVNNNNNNLNKINEKNNYLSEILINNNKKNDNNQHQLQQQQQQNINNKEKSVIEEEEDGIDIVNGTIIQSKTIMKCIGENCEKIYLKNSKNSETIVITEMKLNNDEDTSSSTSTSSSSLENQQNINNNYENYYYKISSKIIRKQRWFIDLAAALGSLSVLLVVGDTWCAVTDPLRYHTRISALKSWILIACTWSFGIIFGLVSALLENIVTSTKTTTITETETLEKLIDPTTNIPIINTENYIYDLNTNYNIEDNNIENKFQYTNNENILTTFSSLSSSSEHLYSMIYSCIYFIVIILLPFGFVCGMYWRIFSEARKNGLRMRQNGSSPLLQSALNLSNTINNNNHHQQQQLQQQLQQHHHHHNSTNGLTMKIDRKNSNDKDVLNPLLPPPPQQPPTQQHQPKSSSSSQSVQINNNNNNNRTQDDCNIGKQNIFLTLSKANDDIKRNSSVQQLRLLDTSSQDLNETQKLSGIRHCQSTPTLLKKNNNNNNNNGNERNNSFCEQIISYTTSLSSSQHHHHHHNALQLPPLHASPKTLSYMTSIRHRLSNASSLFKYREESRAARISILVVIMFLVSYLPYGILILLQELYYNKILLNNSIQLTIIMILIANFSSPFIFAYRNKRVRRGCKRLFGLDKTNTKQLQLNHNLKFFKCYSTHNKTIKNKKLQLKRNTSKLSNYSTNSKYLTPSCFKNHNNDNNDNDNINKINDNNNGILNDTFLNDFEKNLNIKNHNKKNLIEKIHFKTNHINCNTISAIQEKRSFLKIVCDSSRKLGCGTNSCANSDNEQVDV